MLKPYKIWHANDTFTHYCKIILKFRSGFELTKINKLRLTKQYRKLYLCVIIHLHVTTVTSDQWVGRLVKNRVM
jgi:hypothetical protein